MLYQFALGQISTWADRVGPYRPQVPWAEFGLGVRWRLALTSTEVPERPLAFHRWWFLASGVVACHGVALLLDSSVAHRPGREVWTSRMDARSGG